MHSLMLTAVSAGEVGEFTRLMNLGKAHLENRDSKSAIETLTEAVKIKPQSVPARRNLARAFLLARQHEQALESLARAAELEAESVSTEYLTGLTLMRMSRFEDAVPHLENAVRFDPHTATLRFQLANAYQSTGQEGKAAKQLRETVRLDPLHASAHFKLAAHARKSGDREEFQRRTEEFLRLRKLFGDETRSPEALETCIYTFPESVPAGKAADRVGRTPAIEVRFIDGTSQAFATDADRVAAVAAVIDVDDKGRPTLFAADAAGGFALLKMSPGGTFQRTPVDLKLPGARAFTSCVIGDFHNDVPAGVKYDPRIHALNDVLLTGPAGVRLLQRTGSTGFKDVTDSAGLGGVTAVRGCWVDYEHDGDIDLLLAGGSGLKLWQNNGNGRFENVTVQVGIGKTASAVDAAATDLDADVAVDIIVTRGASPTLVFENQRAGRFALMPEPPGPWPTAKRVLADDLNNDGYPDAVLIHEDKVLLLMGRTATRQRIDLSGIDAAAAALVDYDNDGWLDFCAVGTKKGTKDKGAIFLHRNVGTGWTDVSGSTGLASLKTPPLLDLIPADVDADGDTDLIVLASDHRLWLLRNEGGHANGQLKIRLSTIKTNPAGLGTHIELRRGDFWVTRSVTRLPIEIGLAGHGRLDSVQTLWTNGVVDNRIDVAVSREPLTIVEKKVATGSCPFLYAWDGKRFRFVTDLLGNSPIGLPLRRGVMLSADPDELVLIGDAGIFPPRAGAYTLMITDEFREVLYLDHAKLIAVDHPPDVEVHPTDKMMPPPFPPSELWALESQIPLIQANGSDGIDRTEALRAIDGNFAPPGPPLPPPYRGMCHPMSLVLDFGPLDASRPLVLALTGWLQYGDASTNIAMSQNTALRIIPPMLEVETATGSRQPLDVTVGMPAGKTKTILCDLRDGLPVGARRLRLTTTFEIRWDRIALFEHRMPPGSPAGLGPQGGPYATYELLPDEAHLAWRGFSKITSRRPGHPTTPDFNLVSDRPPWRTALRGWCTRYGAVLELLAERDDRLVILNAGDALTLYFPADRLPPVPDGLARTFFFYSVGWDKDGDHNVVGGHQVDPLPRGDISCAERNAGKVGQIEERDLPSRIFAGKTAGLRRRPALHYSSTSEASTEGSNWRLRYNTRWVPADRFKPKR